MAESEQYAQFTYSAYCRFSHNLVNLTHLHKDSEGLFLGVTEKSGGATHRLPYIWHNQLSGLLLQYEIINADAVCNLTLLNHNCVANNNLGVACNANCLVVEDEVSSNSLLSIDIERQRFVSVRYCFDCFCYYSITALEIIRIVESDIGTALRKFITSSRYKQNVHNDLKLYQI